MFFTGVVIFVEAPMPWVTLTGRSKFIKRRNSFAFLLYSFDLQGISYLFCMVMEISWGYLDKLGDTCIFIAVVLLPHFSPGVRIVPEGIATLMWTKTAWRSTRESNLLTML